MIIPDFIIDIECCSCHFWVNQENTDFGECRKNPPILQEHDVHCSSFPVTEKKCWCGAYRLKNEVIL